LVTLPTMSGRLPFKTCLSPNQRLFVYFSQGWEEAERRRKALFC